jgi:hypothetical protein
LAGHRGADLSCRRILDNSQTFNWQPTRFPIQLLATSNMLPTEFTGNKVENTCRGDASPASLGAEPTARPVALEGSSTAERNIPSESKHVFQARAQVPTPPDRQRTAQACDKCRERKTKVSSSCDICNYIQRTTIFRQCSGDHPVCNRCTTRGLICKYSSREARPRGPSKLQLRSTVSPLDLRPPQKTSQNVPAQQPQRVQGHPQKSMSGQFYSRAFVENKHSDYVPRRAAVPQSNHDFLEFHPTPMSGSTPQEYCGMPLLGYEPSRGGTTFIRPQQHISGNKEHFQQRWPEVPHNESHSIIDGGSEGATALQYGLHDPAPFPMVGLNPYGPFSSQGRASPTFQHPLPLLERAAVGQFEAQKTQHVEQMYSWGYHSDSSSSGYELVFLCLVTLILNYI